MKKALAAITLAAAVVGGPATAHAQLSDQSGAITFAMTVAKYVEVVSHAPSDHDLTFYAPQGVPPGTVVGTFNILSFNPPSREVRANTPYRISIVGLQPDGKLVFTNAAGNEVALSTACDLLATNDASTRSLKTTFNCQGSGQFPAAASKWVLFHASAPTRQMMDNTLSGTYYGTVWIQIDAV